MRRFIPIKTVSEANTYGHWSKRAKRAKAQREAAYLSFTKAELPALPSVVTLIRVAPRTLDDDNLRGALKACRDGIADRLGVDDADPRVEWRYAQEKGEPKEFGVVVEIESTA